MNDVNDALQKLLCQLHDAFSDYIDACRKLNQILWDFVSSTDLLQPNKKERFFIDRFQSTPEFNNLVRLFRAWGEEPPEEIQDMKYYDYKLKARESLQLFLINRGIYDNIISGREVDKDNAVKRLFEEMAKDSLEVSVYSE